MARKSPTAGKWAYNQLRIDDPDRAAVQVVVSTADDNDAGNEMDDCIKELEKRL